MATLDQSYTTAPDDYYGVNNATGFTYLAQSFTAGVNGNIDSVKLKLLKANGNPADNVVVGIYSDSGDAPSTLLSSATSVAASTITSTFPTFTIVEFVFSSKPTGVSGTKYWIRVSRSGGTDASNYIGMGIVSIGSYSGGSAKRFDGSVWQTLPNADFYFQEFYVGASGNNTFRSLLGVGK